MEIPNTPEQLLAMADRVMTWDHPRFAEFAAMTDTWDTRGSCGGQQCPRTRAALHVLGCNPERSLAWMAEYGGHCDCEVVWNVVDLWREGPERVSATRREHDEWYRDTKAYSPPGKRYSIRVDKGLDRADLDMLNRIRGIDVRSTCEGHPPRMRYGGDAEQPGIGFIEVQGARLDYSRLAALLRSQGFKVEGQATRRSWHIEPEILIDAGGGPAWFSKAVLSLREAVRVCRVADPVQLDLFVDRVASQAVAQPSEIA